MNDLSKPLAKHELPSEARLGPDLDLFPVNLPAIAVPLFMSYLRNINRAEDCCDLTPTGTKEKNFSQSLPVRKGLLLSHYLWRLLIHLQQCTYSRPKICHRAQPSGTCFPFLLKTSPSADFWVLNPTRGSALALRNAALFGQDLLPARHLNCKQCLPWLSLRDSPGQN